MSLCKIDTRLGSSRTALTLLSNALLVMPLMLCMGLNQPTRAQNSRTIAQLGNAPFTTPQVVENLVVKNLERAHALRAYRGTRIYHVEYRGLGGARSAEMVVDVNYRAPGTKEFTVRSATGSKMIIDKVFNRLLEAEQQALAVEAQKRAALNNDNYEFTMVGYESTPFGSMYVLMVEPKTKDQFLYRGRIWVDAEDFAVVRLLAEPAKNPSFWTKKSDLEQVYVKVNGFWLPTHNRSVSSIRLGGRAELTIQYTNYQITAADPVGNLSTLKASQPEDARRLYP
jgi:hypothetical protein